ncbi:twin-arginine translocation signal domain-containing protein [Candidatus Woesearchaeota archaeon]|nr:twin-arginine translocation signal domain-containing protein [Candidatus Woesearchaeota archaeon]
MTEITRRSFLGKAAVGGAAVTVGGVAAVRYCTRPIPSIDDVDAVASYANDRILSVIRAKQNGPMLLYLLRDVHNSKVHSIHCETIKSLNQYFGANLIGLEGHVGISTKETALEYFSMLRDTGIIHPLEKNSAEDQDRKPRKITTLDEFLEIDPVKQFCFDDRYIVTGLADEETRRISDPLSKLDKLTTMYVRLSCILTEKRIYAEDGGVREKRIYEKVKQKVEPTLKKFRKGMEERIAKLGLKYPLPDIDAVESPYHPPGAKFQDALQVYWEPIKMGQRSKDAVHKAKYWMEQFKLKQCCAIFGARHNQQITDECDKVGISYIVF